MHTYIHTYIHRDLLACLLTYLLTYIRTYLLTCTHAFTSINTCRHTHTDELVHPALRYEAGFSVHVAAALIQDFKQRRQRRDDHRGLQHRSAKSIRPRCLCQRSRFWSFSCLTVVSIVFHQWIKKISSKPNRQKDEKKNQEPNVSTLSSLTATARVFHQWDRFSWH